MNKRIQEVALFVATQLKWAFSAAAVIGIVVATQLKSVFAAAAVIGIFTIVGDILNLGG